VIENREDAVILAPGGNRFFLAIFLGNRWRLADDEPCSTIREVMAFRREYVRCHEKVDVKKLPSMDLIPLRSYSTQESLF
jgi:hypothetical protein